MKDTKVQWHPGFIAAMNLELTENREDLLFEKEYNLNTKPLEIDLLVIKKAASIQIVNEIGRFFRGHNIIEYKSPNDHLDIDTFYKSGAYASLYKAYGKTVDERKADDITISIVRQAKPEKLFRYFKEHGYEVTKPYAGIYYIESNVLFPTQIIVTKELDWKSHIWLRALSGKLEKQRMREILENVYHLTGKEDREFADSVLEVSIGANRQIIEELKGDDNMCKALMEIMEPEIRIVLKEREAEVLNRGLEKGLKQGLKKGLEQGLEQGLERGLEQGLERGLEQGRKEGIRGTVEALRELGHDDSEISTVIMKKYRLSNEEAEKFMDFA